MSISPRMTKAAALLMSGAALGGAGGYAASASGASAPHTSSPKAAHARAHSELARLRRAVSISAVIPDGQGKFATVSIERGTLVSSSGNTIVVNEGNRRASYKTVTLSLPSNTTVRLARQPSSLSALSAGDRVVVLQGPRRTLLTARPPAKTRTSSAAGSEGSETS